MNIFEEPEIVSNYDAYYDTDKGKMVDEIEKGIIAEYLFSLKEKELLELGCGTGHWTAFFEEKGFDVIGIDISCEMMEKAASKGLKAKFHVGDAERLPFFDESIENVASITMLEFVKNQEVVIQEIYRVLKPGGYAIFGLLGDKSPIAKNAANDEIFKQARFLNSENLDEIFKPFQILQKRTGVMYDNEFNVTDYACNLDKIEPAFIALLLKK